MFDVMVWTVMSYNGSMRMESKREDAEKIWKMDFRTRLGKHRDICIVREELKWKKLRLRGAKRAWREERLRKEKKSEWARRCLKKIKRRNEQERESRDGRKREKGIYV